MMKTAIGFAAVIALAGTTWAAPMLRLSDGVNPPVQITDQGAGDLNGVEGVTLWSGSIGVWLVNVSTGLTKPAMGTSQWPDMDLNSVNLSTASGKITIEWTDTDFVWPSSVTGFQTSIGGTTAGALTAKAYYSATNTAFAKTTELSSLSFNSSPFAGSESYIFDPVPTSGRYSLTLVVEIEHKTSGATSFDLALQPVPEPGTLALIGAAGVALALLRRRRKAN